MASQRNRKKERPVKHYYTVNEKIYIFSEGVKTEPVYFEKFADTIKQNPIYTKTVYVHTEGVGRGTLEILKAAKKYVRNHNIHGAKIWCVYDKDEFPENDFNQVSIEIEKLNREQDDVSYHAAWSNVCIEYWFVLHFQEYTSDNGKDQYYKILHKKFNELHYGNYEKNDERLFNIMTERGNPKKAIQRAKKQMKQCEGKTEAKSVPATTVYMLVEELAKYLPEKIRGKYL